ncbi:hypothetical protein [Pseudocitrobacter sp. 73]|uniref:hypothetical protein n=1 Tax=Pseudocitrobacter sp. 73 TaxID=2605731 RepID=UPI0011EE125A|nr:hypothetical protein [Pseudocitrobacter sp. 73]KAA1047284.1 hypothetical protein F0Q32_20410 [Pseudocitrobacter sp. 73]
MDKALAGWLCLVVLALGIGWRVANWQRDSVDLAISKTAAATGAQMEAIASDSGRKLEETLEVLRNAAPREIHTEVLKPIFTNVCVSDEFVSMYNRAADDTERALSGKPEN